MARRMVSPTSSSSDRPARPLADDANGPIGFPMRMVMFARRNLLRQEKISGARTARTRRPENSGPASSFREDSEEAACFQRVFRLPQRSARRSRSADAIQTPQARQPANNGRSERHVESTDEIQRPWHGSNYSQGINEMEMIGSNDQWSRFGDILDSLDANPNH